MGRTEASQSPPDCRNGDHQLTIDDFRHSLDLAMNLGKPPAEHNKGVAHYLFRFPFNCKRVLWDDGQTSSHNTAFHSFLESDSFMEAYNSLVKTLDMDGDGKITPKDFGIMYDSKLSPALSRNRDTLEKWLPFAGQCAFGLAVGLVFGALTRNMQKNKLAIASTGLVLYSGVQYLAQQKYVKKRNLEKIFRVKVNALAHVKGDGEVNRDELNALVENRLRFISTKLGPGGFTPGVVGYASLALGFVRGMRFI
ncbi:hypothetical protein ABL78_1788 [Leptomonas seymouri]|uniref:EF-hand domain-containing protein n=1 Tax=Leptomonas seymouri TaxID=5684 RepID=A0A0N1I8G7_LEPSE|nr:hypothetical protein ABL78_1788 [Leptomonas seymouri]|eukprot:KPI89144.1 hypothetical protein ABL78_1788 [Leptomonas seymouri]